MTIFETYLTLWLKSIEHNDRLAREKAAQLAGQLTGKEIVALDIICMQRGPIIDILKTELAKIKNKRIANEWLQGLK